MPYKSILRFKKTSKRKILIFNCDFDEGRENTGLAIKNIMKEFKVDIVSSYKNESADLKKYDGFVITGSSANVDDGHKWIDKLSHYITKIEKFNVPLLGICFGHQLVAHTFGGKVIKAKKVEFGYTNINLTKDGRNHQLFKNVIKEFPTFEWHRYIVRKVPRGAKVLAKRLNFIQAYSYKNFLGIQFHPEIDDHIVKLVSEREGKTFSAPKSFLEIERTVNKKILSNFGDIIKYWEL